MMMKCVFVIMVVIGPLISASAPDYCSLPETIRDLSDRYVECTYSRTTAQCCDFFSKVPCNCVFNGTCPGVEKSCSASPPPPAPPPPTPPPSPPPPPPDNYCTSYSTIMRLWEDYNTCVNFQSQTKCCDFFSKSVCKCIFKNTCPGLEDSCSGSKLEDI